MTPAPYERVAKVKEVPEENNGGVEPADVQ
jgi:hypothetical protein